MTGKPRAPYGASPKERNTKNMFGKRRTPDLGDKAGMAEEGMEAESIAIPPTRPAARPAPTSPQDPIRRPTDPIPSAGRRIEPMTPPDQSANEGRKLVVGQDISLSGEIKSCQKLVVEGQVESSMTECSICA